MAQAKQSRLGNVKRQTLDSALRYLFYGGEGTGKSTLAAHARNPIFFDIENGTERLEIARYPFHDGVAGHVPRNYSDVIEALLDIRDAEHDFGAIVIDTVDRLEAMVWEHVCQRYSGEKSQVNQKGRQLESIEDFGYGKGFNVALDEWRNLCRLLDTVRLRRGMDVILIGHAHVKVYKNPLGEDFDRIQLRVHDKAGGFLKEWADVVGFIQPEQWGKVEEGTRNKGVSTGRLLCHFRRTAAYDAKSRVPLPDEIELDEVNPWAPLAEAVDRGKHTSPDDLRAAIDAELERIGDEVTTEKAAKAVKQAGDDAATLARFLAALKQRSPKEEA